VGDNLSGTYQIRGLGLCLARDRIGRLQKIMIENREFSAEHWIEVNPAAGHANHFFSARICPFCSHSN
jgi:hypothetical protein